MWHFIIGLKFCLLHYLRQCLYFSSLDKLKEVQKGSTSFLRSILLLVIKLYGKHNPKGQISVSKEKGKREGLGF